MDFKNAFNESALLAETDAQVSRKLLDLATLYGELVETLKHLQADLTTGTTATPA